MPSKKDELAERMKKYALFIQYLSVWVEHNQGWILKQAYRQFQKETGLTV